MAKVLGELQSKYAGQISVQYYFIETDEPMFKRYQVSLVPTLVILGPSGSEIYRHEGALSKEAMVSTLKSMNLIHGLTTTQKKAGGDPAFFLLTCYFRCRLNRPWTDPAPLSRLFLFVKGRHLPQGLDDARHDFEHLVDVGLGVVQAQGEDQGALGQGVAQPGADEDVGGPERPGGAGGPGGHDDAFLVQHHHQALAFDVFHRHGEEMRQALGGVAVDLDLGDALGQGLGQAIFRGP